MCGAPNEFHASVPGFTKRASSLAAQSGATAAPAALTILVVDDDRVVGQLLADGLAVMGHAVAVTQSAKEAWQMLQDRHDIGVVVSDIRMPGGNGLELAIEVVARLEDARAAAVVLITGHATIEDAAAAMRLGAVDLLSKPCRLGELVSAVDKALDKARERRSGAPGAPALGGVAPHRGPAEAALES